MIHMPSQLTKEFWTYLHDQAESHEQAYFQTMYDYAYQDEMRAAADTYDWLAKEFSLCFATAVSAVAGMEAGLTAQGTSEFLHLLDEKLQQSTLAREQIRSKKQEALAKAHGWEYYHIRRIYSDMENLTECQSGAYRNSRERFLRMLDEG